MRALARRGEARALDARRAVDDGARFGAVGERKELESEAVQEVVVRAIVVGADREQGILADEQGMRKKLTSRSIRKRPPTRART